MSVKIVSQELLSSIDIIGIRTLFFQQMKAMVTNDESSIILNLQHNSYYNKVFSTTKLLSGN